MSHGNAPVQSDSSFGRPADLPYRTGHEATAGHSASGASAERAVREARNGHASARQAQIIALLSDAGPVGMTWIEIARRTGDHHGQVSGALSTLHKSGRIAALKNERREKSGVYVLPQYVGGREVREFLGRTSQSDAEIMQATLEREGVPTGRKTGSVTDPATVAQAQVYARPSDPEPSLTETEAALVKRVRDVTKQYRDKGGMQVRVVTVADLLAIIDRLTR